MTETVADVAPQLPGFDTVIVYVVVSVGETSMTPDGATRPTVGVIKTVVALVDDQFKRADPPRRISPGDAVIPALTSGPSLGRTALPD
jgi:hypothetical protein